ncbi:MAG: glycosyltransferase family 4 protein [Nitrospiraceae bacterium]|nr:glycosyltransferase family 4 protein [Nitrospiraceae bacterium]
MRIAMLCWESLHSIPVGGVAVHVTELAAALERRGNEVHVFTRMGPGQAAYERIEGVHYHRCAFRLNPDFIEEILDMCRSLVHHVFATEDYMGAHFDIVNAHDWLAASAMAWIKQGRGRKSILTVHSTEYGRCGNNFHDGRSSRIRAIEREGASRADRIIAVSYGIQKELMWMYEVPSWKVSIVFNGVNLHHFDGWIDPAPVKAAYGIGLMDPMVLFCGRMVYQKGPDLLAEAVPHILWYYPNAKFVFVGDGELKGQVEGRARQIGISHATRFLGFKNGQELANLYRACDVVCVPSRNEPFGIVVLEAWSAGKPVIATRNGGPDEFVWHEVNGLKIDPAPGSIAWGIGTIFTNFEWARWMGGNGRQTVEKAFSWDAVGGRVSSVYRDLLGMKEDDEACRELCGARA